MGPQRLVVVEASNHMTAIQGSASGVLGDRSSPACTGLGCIGVGTCNCDLQRQQQAGRHRCRSGTLSVTADTNVSPCTSQRDCQFYTSTGTVCNSVSPVPLTVTVSSTLQHDCRHRCRSCVPLNVTVSSISQRDCRHRYQSCTSQRECQFYTST